MSWLAIVLWILANAGSLISLVKQIIDLIHTLPKDEAKQARLEVSDAIKANDHNIIKGVLQKWIKRCNGIACAAELKGE